MTDPAFTQLCKDLEHWETPAWAAKAILEKEILTRNVIDPCCGTGILADAAYDAGYHVLANDIENWGYSAHNFTEDFLTSGPHRNDEPFTIFMNPPFSVAEAFVDKARELGARKIVCFQRFAWYEGSFDKGKKRGQWWDKNPPNRVYICGDRATCWRHDIPAAERGEGTPTAHAWFVWEKGHPPGTQLSHIYKSAG